MFAPKEETQVRSNETKRPIKRFFRWVGGPVFDPKGERWSVKRFYTWAATVTIASASILIGAIHILSEYPLVSGILASVIFVSILESIRRELS
jgi:hypothetical protein